MNMRGAWIFYGRESRLGWAGFLIVLGFEYHYRCYHYVGLLNGVTEEFSISNSLKSFLKLKSKAKLSFCNRLPIKPR
jgi:hypothetical protein